MMRIFMKALTKMAIGLLKVRVTTNFFLGFLKAYRDI